MTNFIIAPTLTMGMKAPFEGILLATTWPIGNALGKIEKNASPDYNTLYVVESEENNQEHLKRILETFFEGPAVIDVQKVSA